MVEQIKSDQLDLKNEVDAHKAVSIQILQTVKALMNNTQAPFVAERKPKVAFNVDVAEEQFEEDDNNSMVEKESEEEPHSGSF